MNLKDEKDYESTISITLAEWKQDDTKGRWVPVCVKTERVDGIKIKPDTWYKLKDGEFFEVTK